MVDEVEIFAEGPDEQVFLASVLRHLGLPEVAVSAIGGGVTKLHAVKNQILRSHHAGNRVVTILDADTNFEDRCKQYLAKREELALPIADFFLMPDHCSTGDLEILLQGIAVEEHQVIYQCLSQYENCLRQENGSYCGVPIKGQVYAYCQALGIKPKPKDRGYAEREYWNLDAPCLDPLKEFLEHVARQ